MDPQQNPNESKGSVTPNVTNPEQPQPAQPAASQPTKIEINHQTDSETNTAPAPINTTESSTGQPSQAPAQLVQEPEKQPSNPVPPPPSEVPPAVSSTPTPPVNTTPDTQKAANTTPNATETAEFQQGTPAKPSRNKRVVVLFVAALLIITAVGVFAALKVFSSSLKLDNFSNDRFSISYPQGYQKEEQDNAIAFKEPEGDENTLSAVVVAVDDLPASVDAQKRNLLKGQLEEQINAFMESTITKDGHELRNQKTSAVKIDQNDATRVDAELYESDQKVGDFHVVAAVTDKKVVIEAVLVHVSDPQVEAKSQDILNSFKLK